MAKCFVPLCKETSPLFRVNAKGQPGIWACERHIKNTDATVHPETKRVVALLAGKHQ